MGRLFNPAIADERNTLGMITITLVTIVVSLFLWVVHWAKEANKEWKRKGIKHRKPYLFFGNTLEIYMKKKHVSVLYKEICSEFSDESIIGFFDFTKPFLLVVDPHYVEKVLIKDFVHFIDHGFEINEEKNPIDAQLFSMVGKRWRAFRYKLTPIFTSGKLKNMFDSMTECGDDLEKHLQKLNKVEVNMKQLMTQFTMDIVGSSVFGIQPKALQNPNSKFCKLATDIFAFGVLDSIKFILMSIAPNIAKKFGFTINNNPEALNYFCNLLQNTFEYRKKNNIQRNDFIQLLMSLKQKEKIEIQRWDPHDDYLRNGEIPGDSESYEITDNIIMAQAYSFLTNGLDGLGLTMTYAFVELSKRPEIQQMAREEIKAQIKQHEGFTYTALKNMIYLEQIVKETLRIYPITPHIFRICNKEYTFPNGYVVKERDLLRIPLNAIHMNPNYYPEPEVFKPERFDIPPKPGTYLPFGDGPRVCIAMRYAVLTVKYGIGKVLLNYNVKLNPKTELPFKMKPNALVNTPEKTLLFDLEEVN